MTGFHYENVLQEEGVQFRKLPHDNEARQDDSTLDARFTAQPASRSPAGWCELQNNAFYFPRCRLYLTDALPMVGTHFQPLDDFHSGEYPHAIANDDIEEYTVPPAFAEIWEDVTECQL